MCAQCAVCPHFIMYSHSQSHTRSTREKYTLNNLSIQKKEANKTTNTQYALTQQNNSTVQQHSRTQDIQKYAAHSYNVANEQNEERKRNSFVHTINIACLAIYPYRQLKRPQQHRRKHTTTSKASTSCENERKKNTHRAALKTIKSRQQRFYEPTDKTAPICYYLLFPRPKQVHSPHLEQHLKCAMHTSLQWALKVHKMNVLILMTENLCSMTPDFYMSSLSSCEFYCHIDF